MADTLRLKDSGGALYAGQAVTVDEQSEAFALCGNTVLLALDCGAVTGTSPTLDAQLEWRKGDDDGEWKPFPAAKGLAPGQAALAQCTTTGDEVHAYFDNPFPDRPEYQGRVSFVMGGTTPSFTVDQFLVVQK